MKESQDKKSIIGSHPEGSRNSFTHCPKDPDGEICKQDQVLQRTE